MISLQASLVALENEICATDSNATVLKGEWQLKLWELEEKSGESSLNVTLAQGMRGYVLMSFE